MEPEIEEKKVPCPNCGKKMAKKGKFCPHCGQKNNKGKVSMQELFGRFFQNITHLNSKVLKGMWQLLIPGLVTTEYFKGRMKRYPNPAQFFFVVMFFFLLLLNYFLSDKQLQAFDGFSFNNVEQNADGGIQNEFFEKIQRRATVIELHRAYEKLPPELHKPGTRRVLDSVLVEAGYAEADQPTDTLSDWLKQTLESRIDSLKQVVEKLDTLSSPSEKARFEATLDSLQNIVNDADADDFISNDTVSISFVNQEYRLAITDLAKSSADVIIQKYGVTGFWNRLLLRQGIKSIREPQVLMKYYLGSLTWTLLALITFMALILKVLYIRRNRYYVEHFIFLLHQHSSLFLVLVICMLLSMRLDLGMVWPVVGIWLGLSTLWAMKRFYAQGWLKTFFKWLLFNIVYLLAFVIFLTLGVIASIVLF